jgi:uncharacterized membrane protein HdeD (DUF308 family)
MNAQQKPTDGLPTPTAGLGVLQRSWVLFAVLGGALAVLGLLAIGASFITTLATIMVFGILLLIGGGVEIVNSLSARAWRGFFMHLLAGVFYVIVGLLMIEHPLETAAGLTLMLGVFLLVAGAFRTVLSALDRIEGWVWSLCSGVVAIVLGVLICVRWPESSFRVIGLFVGIELLVNGWSWVMLALGLRNLSLQEAPRAATAEPKEPPKESTAEGSPQKSTQEATTPAKAEH